MHRILGLAAALAVAACGCGGSSSAGGDPGSGLDAPSAIDVPLADAGADLPDPGGARDAAEDTAATDVGAADTTATDPGVADPGATDPGIADVGTPDPGSEDPGASDPGATDPGTDDPGAPDPDATDPGLADPGTADVAGPADAWPFVQCTKDEDCQAALGAPGYCNRNFPGGQCQGCDPANLGTEKCGLLGQDGLTLTCKEFAPNLCLFDCPCPSWLKCSSEDLCILRTCTTDAECAPFVCRPLSEGGTSYCLGEAQP